MNIIQYKSLDAPIADVDKKKREIVQRYTRYNVLDSDRDIGRKGMFNKTWNDNRDRIKHLLNHDPTQVPGKTIGLWEDNDYAYGQSQIGTHALGNDFLEMVDSGIITEASYGYQVVRQQKTAEGNNLLEVKLMEWSSLTAWGANQYTNIVSYSKGAKTEDERMALLKKMQDRTVALEKFCRNTNATDETVEALLFEIKQMQQYILNLSETSTPAAIEAQVPQKKGFNAAAVLIALNS